MLERLLKPTTENGVAKDASNARRSIKRPHAEISPTDTKPTNHSTANGSVNVAPIKAEPQTPTTQMHDLNMSDFHDDADDMDFSMLDDAENQFTEQSTATNVTSNDKAKQIKEELMKKENETYAKLLSNWENDISADIKDADDELLGAFDVEAAQAMVTNNVDDNSTLKFWYWDAYEDPIKLPGKLFLFGKMVSDKNPKEFKSVCVTVENVQRCLYLLPRKYVSI